MAATVAACVGGAARRGAAGSAAPAHGDARQGAADAPGRRDPELRVGTLPNGMRYYIRANRMPAERANLWLAVNAGSVLEDEDQQGFAHFLEHMAFNGTTHFPGQQLVDFVESSGMRFGADLNAYTSFDETVYMLTVPTDDPASLRQGLQVLEDWAGGGITIDSAEVVAERGVVMGEWRLRTLTDTLTQRLRDYEYDRVFGGTRYRERFPIGKPELIEAASPAALERFYRDWYRPDLMAVIAVGDFDPDAIEREVRERFGAIPAAEDRREREAVEVDADHAPVVDVQRDRVGPRVDVLWPVPERPRDVADGVRHDLVSTLLLEHVQRKLLRIREQRSRPFIDARIGRQRIVRPMDRLAVRIIAWPDSLESALGTVLTELERVARHGIPEPELERRKVGLLRRLERRAAGADAIASATYANAYVDHYLTGAGALLSPAQELTLAREILPRITPGAVADAARFWREREGLKILFRIPKFAYGFRPPTRESVLALMDSIRSAPLAPDTARAVATDGALMERLPEPGRVVGETRHEAAGVVEWRLSNGARVLFKPSANHPDEVLLRAWSPGGFSRVPDPLFYGPGRLVARIMTEAAGLGERDHDQVLDRLSTAAIHPPRVDIGYADESIELGGSPRELEALFQMLHLQFTAPKLDSADVAAWAGVAKYQGGGGSIHDQLNQIFARGNDRLAPVTNELAEFVRVDDALAVYHDRFGNAGDFTFLLVGAATAEQVKPLVERYIASLPATDVRETPADPNVRPLVGRIRERHEVLPIPTARTLLVFDGTFPTEPETYFRERQKLSLLSLVLERRLRNRLREEMSGTYGVTVQGLTYRLYDEHFRILLNFESAPDDMRAMSRAMFAIIDSMRASGATEAELARAARVQRRQLETALQNNRFWLDQLELYSRLGLPLDRIVSPFVDETPTPEMIAAAAEKYLPEKTFIHLTQVPREGTEQRTTDRSKQ
ncbi:MAG TPA: insulinase family protein [Longimicrobiales bacterium]